MKYESGNNKQNHEIRVKTRAKNVTATSISQEQGIFSASGGFQGIILSSILTKIGVKPKPNERYIYVFYCHRAS